MGALMRILWAIGILVVFTVSVFAVDSAIVAAAKKEKERREKLAHSKVITNQDVEEKHPGAAKKTDEEGPSEPLPSLKNLYPQSSTTMEGDEAYWRERFADLKEQVARTTRRIDNLKETISAKQKSIKPGELEKDLAGEILALNQELGRSESRLRELQQLLEDLPGEARKAGANPEWVQDPISAHQ